MNFFKKLKEKPEHIRKAVLWSVVISVGLVFSLWWVHDSKKRINEFRDKNIINEINLPDIEKENY
jgi:hypothetical protein